LGNTRTRQRPTTTQAPPPNPPGLLPRFAPPPDLTQELPLLGTPAPTSPPPSETGPKQEDLPRLGNGAAPAGIPTGIYSAGPGRRAPTPGELELTGKAAASILAALGILAALTVRALMGRRLREPSADQCDAIGAPVGKILARHFDPSWLNNDLANAAEATAALGRYLSDGPLLEPRPGPMGLPDDLAGRQESRSTP
jgi:hypothetical protein